MTHEESNYQAIRKSTLFWLIFIVIVNLFLLGIGKADAQTMSLVDGSFSNAYVQPVSENEIQKDASLLTEIVCKELNFWTVNAQGVILQWQLAGSSVSLTDTIFQTSPLASLAYTDDLNGGSLSRTFYGTNTYLGSDVYFYDGQDWDTLPFSDGPTIPNSGGYHSFLYFQSLIHSSISDAIIRFDGIQLDTVFVLPFGRNFTIADIAIDALGNIWCATGSQLQSDSIIVISPSGSIIQSFAMNMNTTHAYGCFLLNDEFYVVFGSGNPQYPSSIVQFNFSGNQAAIQQVIPFPNNDFTDVASCVPGMPLILGADDTESKKSELVLSPNPVGSVLNIHFPFEENVTLILIVYDRTGREVLRKEMNSFDLELELSGMAKGIYMLRMLSGQKMYTSRFLKD